MTDSPEAASFPTESSEVDGPRPVPLVDEDATAAQPIALPMEAPVFLGADETGATYQLGELKAAVSQFVVESEKHHQRAAHRESVIDGLHTELEKLRTGERRGIIRPLLAAVARLRDDLVEQATALPVNFDVVRAQKLLLSFADSIEITLEDFGVATYTPEVGEDFDPRRHRAVASEPSENAALIRKVARTLKDGYQDVVAGVTLTQAEVSVFVDAPRACVDDVITTGAGVCNSAIAATADSAVTPAPGADTASVPSVS